MNLLIKNALKSSILVPFAILALSNPAWGGEIQHGGVGQLNRKTVSEETLKKGHLDRKPERKPKFEKVTRPVIKTFSWDWRGEYVTQQTVQRTRYVNIHVWDSDGLRSVEIRFCGTRVFRIQNPGTTFSNSRLPLDLSRYIPRTSGPQTMQALAYDTKGNRSSMIFPIKVDVVPPRFTITNNPVEDGIVYSMGSTTDITFEINATDDYSGVDNIIATDIHNTICNDIDETPPYRVTLRRVPEGSTRYLMIQCHDKAGNLAQKNIEVEVRRRTAERPEHP